MKRREEEKGRGVWEKEGSLMRAVNPTTAQQPSLSPSTSQQKIYVCSLSIPPISCEGSADGSADKWTASEALASRVWYWSGDFFPPSSFLGWGVCSGLTGWTEHPATWKPPPGTRLDILPVHLHFHSPSFISFLFFVQKKKILKIKALWVDSHLSDCIIIVIQLRELWWSSTIQIYHL